MRHSNSLISSYSQANTHATTLVSSTTSIIQILCYHNGKIFLFFFTSLCIIHHIHKHHHPWAPLSESWRLRFPLAIHLSQAV